MFKTITLSCGQGEDSTSDIALQYALSEDGTYAEIDYLLFFDSRGLTTENNDLSLTHLKLLVENLVKKNKSVIALSRPKNLTTFSTLVNFLHLHTMLKFKYLITNVRFVDCTPKKQKFIDDILLQLGEVKDKNNIIFLEKYLLTNGELAELYSINYSSTILNHISQVLTKSFEKVYFLNTPEIDRTHKLTRTRPTSFYKNLKTSNKLILSIAKNIENSHIIDIKTLGKDKMISYDSVHYTTYGHRLIYQKIMDII